MRLQVFHLPYSIPFLAVLMFGCATLVDTIPPDTVTQTLMHDTFDRIEAYIEENGNVPRSLSVLPLRRQYADRTTDGWGRELLYIVGDDETITLKSLGADGQTGGHGEDSDIMIYRMPRNSDGSTNADDP